MRKLKQKHVRNQLYDFFFLLIQFCMNVKTIQIFLAGLIAMETIALTDASSLHDTFSTFYGIEAHRVYISLVLLYFGTKKAIELKPYKVLQITVISCICCFFWIPESGFLELIRTYMFLIVVYLLLKFLPKIYMFFKELYEYKNLSKKQLQEK